MKLSDLWKKKGMSGLLCLKWIYLLKIVLSPKTSIFVTTSHPLRFLTRNVDAIHGYYPPHMSSQPPDYKDWFQKASQIQFLLSVSCYRWLDSNSSALLWVIKQSPHWSPFSAHGVWDARRASSSAAVWRVWSILVKQDGDQG